MKDDTYSETWRIILLYLLIIFTSNTHGQIVNSMSANKTGMYY